MIKYVCDRCGKDISDNERFGYIGISIRDKETGEVVAINDDFAECDYCDSCVEEIKAFIRNKPKKKVINRTKIVIKDDENVSKSTETVAKQPAVKAENEQQAKKKNKIDVPKIFALKNAGWSVEKIAEEMRISKQSIYHHLQRHKDEYANAAE